MEPMQGAIRQDNWFVLVDPNWHADTAGDSPPPEVMVGGWMLDTDDALGPFHPNPQYMPLTDSTPSDPVDAILQLIARGEDRAGEIIPALQNQVVQIACDDSDQPVIGSAPDGVSCALVITAEIHKRRLSVPRWWPVVGKMLPEIVPLEADILVNPDGDRQFRLANSALRRTEQ
ncbi:type VII secretion system-associated protein [Nocardia sp. NPDC057030]|uniref:type VII secretion system-associated protein n=1 Tax=unclassified Nocardia TaxID=2637762 RepID=UPI0036431833